MIIHRMKQRSPEWFAVREGKLSASMMSRVVGGNPSSWSKVIDAIEGRGEKVFQNYAMSRGVELESSALANYELENPTVNVEEVGFVIHQDYDWLGCSPDALVLPKGGAEIKCPLNQDRHLQTISGGMPDQHVPQVQSSIWVCEADWWDFISFDPRLAMPEDRYYCERVYRDDRYIKRMEKTCLEFRDFWLNQAEPPVANMMDVPTFF